MVGSEGATGEAELRRLLESWRETPAFVRDRYLNVVASNEMARALSPAYVPGTNLARFTFLRSIPDPDSDAWVRIASDVVALLRDSVEQHEADRDFLSLVGELSSLSPLFAGLWADEDRPLRHSNSARFRHESVGPLMLIYQELRLPDDFESVLVVWRPADSESSRQLERLQTLVHGGLT